MKKRIVCFLLALIMVLGLIPNAAVTANAYSTCATSAKAIEILKGSVTFYAKAQNNKVGYSTPTSYEGVKNYELNGITEEDAVDLMRDYIEDVIDVAVNNFAKSNNVDLAQNEHDALAVHMYRTGADNGLFETVRTIKTVNSAADRADMVAAFVKAYSHNVGSNEVLETTLDVSLAEAGMYLYGDYGYNGNSKLGYARLSVDGNNSAEVVLAYVKNDGLALKNPSKLSTSGLSDNEFLGWFVYDSEEEGPAGAPITKLTKDHNGKLIIAKKATGGNDAAEYTINTSTLADLNVYSYGSTPVKTDVQLKNNTKFYVSYEYMDADGVKWVFGTGTNTSGKEAKGWIKVGKVTSSGTTSDKPIASATVTSATLNIRAGATAGSDDLGDLKKGDVVNVYEIKVEKTETGNQNWGKIKLDNGTIGWINLAYTEVNETQGNSAKPEGQTGKIANAENVNIRSSAGIPIPDTNKIASLKAGTKVTVLETTTVNGAQWGKIKWTTPASGYTQGWVYMHYVQLDSAYAGSTGSSNETVKYTGVVTSNINLNVRKSADIYSAKVDSLPTGTKINIYETKTSRNMKWGRIGENRWVCLTYVNLTEVEQPAEGSTATTTSTQATVTAATLDVLKNYNSNAEKVGSLKKGDVVTILEKNTESTGTGSRIWGRISKDGVAGWINLAYVELKTVTSVSGSTGSSSSGTTNANGASAVISNCISVNIREGAGVSNKQITKLNNGTAVKVYEQVTKDNAPWAKITWNNGANSGWVCMNYVTMSAAGTGTTTEGGLVNGTNSNTISATGYVNSNIDLNVRSVAGLNGIKLGSLKKGTKVTIYEQVTADGMIWGRMQYGNGSGWVCMSYITVESASSTGKGVMGTIARCFAAVNVRSAPGTGNALIGRINVGTRVEVFETRTYSGQLWGRVAQGWICMDYVLLDSELPEGEILDAPTTAPSTEAATQPQETINRDNEVLYTINGTVLADPLNVRNDADADSDRVGTVKKDLEVKILALKNNGAELWGRIDQYATAGWVNMDYVSYSVHGYVNTDEQPVFANADTSSTVKENLAINTELTITKLTVGGETVYGWVNSASAWIPMGRISNEPVDVIPTYQSTTDSFGSDAAIGTTNTATEIVSVINGSKVVFNLKSGVKVYVGEIRVESGIVWGKLKANGAEGWINMAKVNYTLSGTAAGVMNVRSTKSTADETNILGTVENGITLCELSFDSVGNLWGKVTGYTTDSGEAVNNGGYVMVCAYSSNGEPGTVYVTTAVQY